MVQSIYTSCYLIWSDLVARGSYLEIFSGSKFQVNEKIIGGGFPLLVTLKSWPLQDCSS